MGAVGIYRIKVCCVDAVVSVPLGLNRMLPFTMYNTSYKTKLCLAEFKGFAQLCLCRRRVRIRNFVFPALVTAFSPRALLGFGVFKLRRVLVRKVPIVIRARRRSTPVQGKGSTLVSSYFKTVPEYLSGPRNRTPRSPARKSSRL